MRGNPAGGPQAEVAARIPGAAGLGLLAPPYAAAVPGERVASAPWVAEQIARRRSLLAGGGDERVQATVWWYSASAVLLAPPLAGLVVGRPLSARLADLVVSVGSDGLPVAAVTSRETRDPAEELRECLAAVVAAVAEAGRMRQRPLWAIATDSLANQLLALGRAVGDVRHATALAGPLAAAIGRPLPVPHDVDVGAARFTRRASCCLVYRLPGGALCTSCPRRPPAERQRLLERAASFF